MNPYKITYTENPARISDEQLAIHNKAYTQKYGRTFICFSLEGRKKKNNRTNQKDTNNRACQSNRTKEQRKAHNRTSQVRNIAYKKHDEQYSPTYLVLHKEEMKKSRVAYYKENKEMYTKMYDERRAKREAKKRRAYQSEWQSNYRLNNPDAYKARNKFHNEKEKSPEAIAKKKAYTKAWRDKNKAKIKAYNAEYKELHKERLKEQAKDYIKKERSRTSLVS